MVFLDEHGYPTDEWLNFIKSFVPTKEITIMDFVTKYLKNGWWESDWGFVLRKKYKGKRKLELHTGGWSGNSEIIDVLINNMYLTHFKMNYVMWRSGGHYYFEIKD